MTVTLTVTVTVTLTVTLTLTMTVTTTLLILSYTSTCYKEYALSIIIQSHFEKVIFITKRMLK